MGADSRRCIHSGRDRRQSEAKPPTAAESYVRGELCASGADLYGAAERGGLEGSGTSFSMTTNGVFALLHTFAAEHVVPSGNYTNKDGIGPVGTLLALGNTLIWRDVFGIEDELGGHFWSDD